MEEQELHLRDYLKTLEKRKYIALAAFVVVFVFAALKAHFTVPVYRATTTVLIQKSEPPGVSLANSYYYGWDPDFYQTQIQVIKSALIGEKVVALLKQQADREYREPMKRSLFSIFRGGKSTAAIVKDFSAPGLAKQISGGLAVNLVKDSKILNISYASSNPEYAALIANTAAQAYMEELLEMNIRSTRYAIDWLTEKSEEEQAKLKKAEKELQSFVKDADIIALEYRLKVIPEELSALSVQLAEAETVRKERETVISNILRHADDPRGLEAIKVIESDASVMALKEQVLEAEQNVRTLSKKFTAKHPTMLAAARDLAILQTKRKEEVQRVIDSLQNEAELAKAKEEDLRNRIAAIKEEAFGLKDEFIQYQVMRLGADTNRQFYDALLKKTKEYTINEQLQSIQVSVLEKAEVPSRPVTPDKPKSILFGLFLALFAGAGAAFFVEYLDQTVKSPEELERKTGLPVLGLIPLFKEKGKNIEEILVKDPSSYLSESYKGLRTSVLLSSVDSPPKSILVTSMIPGEGKTTTAINLAVATAQSGYKVLLVDCDLRKPQIHKQFGVKNMKGLSTFLAGVSNDDIISDTPVPNLSVMAPGPVPPNPSELISSRKMERLLERMKEKYDIIIFDSPPLLTVADSMVISRYLDVTLVITRAGKTNYEMVRRGLKMLKEIKTPILGAVINAHEEKKSGYYTYYKYYDQYYKDEEQAQYQ
jgi:capsular exopolysaccharide synthesis family protein